MKSVLGVPFGFKLNAFIKTNPNPNYTGAYKESKTGNPNEFLGELDAGLKAGILFKDWGHKGNEIWLPFYWLNYPFTDPPVSMVDAWSTSQDIDFKKLEVLYQCSMDNIIDRTQIRRP